MVFDFFALNYINSLSLLLSYFEKTGSFDSGVSISIFVALSVRMCVAGANKVGGTTSWRLGTNEILAFKHDIPVPKVKPGHFETTILVLHNFVVFYYG